MESPYCVVANNWEIKVSRISRPAPTVATDVVSIASCIRLSQSEIGLRPVPTQSLQTSISCYYEIDHCYTNIDSTLFNANHYNQKFRLISLRAS